MKTKFKFIKKVKNQKGFSLVELMVVVAIIGILAAIAIPSYQKFQRRARQAEPKTMLSSIYTAQITFIAEYGLGSSNLLQLGITPGGQVQYLTGFAIDSPAPLNVNVTDRTLVPGYRGPIVDNPDDRDTFFTCTVSDSGFSGSNLPGCTVPLGASKNVDGDSLAIGDVKGGCSTTTSGETCTFNLNTNTCDSDQTSNTCSETGAGVTNIARNSVNFTISSIGNIGGKADDQWLMDTSKNLINIQNGVE